MRNAIHMKKVKLVAGHLLAASSADIRVDEVPVYKFALDKEDYDYHVKCAICGHGGERETVYELIEKEPTDTTKGVKHAKTELRVQKEILTENPLGGRDDTLQDQEEDEIALIKRSSFFDGKAAKYRNQRGPQLDSYEAEMGDRFVIDERIKHGMSQLLIKKYLASAVGPVLSAKLASEGVNINMQDKNIDRVILNTLAQNKKYTVQDFEKGLAPNYVEFESKQEAEHGATQSLSVFDRNKVIKEKIAIDTEVMRKPKPTPSTKQAKKKPAKVLIESEEKPRPVVSKNSSSSKKYVLYEDEDPAFGIYTNVQINKRPAQHQPVTKFKI